MLTYRTDELHRRHPLRPFLAELDRSGRAERLDVDRFERADLADMLAGILGAPPDAGLLERIYDRSQGNAFFAEELVAAGQQDDGRGLPPRLENVVLARIQVLPDDTQAVLRIAAAGSRRIEHGLLAAVAQLPEAELLDALRAAVAHQVLVPDPVSETYAFRHALTEEALYGQLLPGERARLHAAFARAISERPDLAGPDPAAMPAWLAYHWVKAHDLVRALPAAIQAGLQSQAAYAFADAYQHFETALELWDQVADPEQQMPSTVQGCCGTRPSRRTWLVIPSGRSRDPGGGRPGRRAATRYRRGCRTTLSAGIFTLPVVRELLRNTTRPYAGAPAAAASRAGAGPGSLRRSAHGARPPPGIPGVMQGGDRDRRAVGRQCRRAMRVGRWGWIWRFSATSRLACGS